MEQLEAEIRQKDAIIADLVQALADGRAMIDLLISQPITAWEQGRAKEVMLRLEAAIVRAKKGDQRK